MGLLAHGLRSFNRRGRLSRQPQWAYRLTDDVKSNCHSELVSESVQRYELVSNIGQTLNQVQGDIETRRCLTGLPRRSLSSLLAMTPPEAASCLGWALKSHVQPLWMALSAFTMAEILLSLTIIGVVAAITLPSLTGNINERTWNTQRKALYARFSQAMALMPSLNGYGTFSAEQTDSSGSITQSAVDTTTETFITDGLAKVMKINNICDNEHLEDCGIPSTISPGNGASAVNISDITSLRGFNSLFAASAAKVPLDTKAAAFETQNGESIIVYYNPNCTPDMSGNSGNYYPHAEMCANFVYDLNGNKGPNTVGKDIGFITAFYPTDPIIVSPMPLATDATWASQIDASKSCQKQDSESRLPNLNELASMMYNRKLLGITTGDYWSSSSVSASQGWIQNFSLGNRYLHPRGNSLAVRCVKR